MPCHVVITAVVEPRTPGWSVLEIEPLSPEDSVSGEVGDPGATPTAPAAAEAAANTGKDRVTAFISWAHDDEVWQKAIAGFALKLRELGIEADVDLFHLDKPGINWTTYGPQAIEDNDVVIIAASPAYRERWEGRGDPRQGAGAAREANVLKTLFNENQETFLHKVKVVVLNSMKTQDIPAELRAVNQRSLRAWRTDRNDSDAASAAIAALATGAHVRRSDESAPSAWALTRSHTDDISRQVHQSVGGQSTGRASKRAYAGQRAALSEPVTG